jgi:hypothetical protein
VVPGDLLEVQFTTSDPDIGRRLVYSVGPGAPPGTSIDPSTGLFTWTPGPAEAGQIYLLAVTVAVRGVPGVTDTQPLMLTVLASPQVEILTTMRRYRSGVDQGTSVITILFNEPLAPSAGDASFYEVETPRRVRVGKRIATRPVPVRFTAKVIGANGVALSLARPSKAHFTLIVRAGVPAANGLTLGQAYSERVK